MNILITGIHGFVGGNLIDNLSKHHTIYGLDLISPEKRGVVKTFSWEDFDNNQLPKVDAIIHLAGKAHDTKNKSEAQTYFDVNTGLTQKIFDWFLRSSAGKFVFFSSVKAAADFVPGEMLTEKVLPAPKGPYGESKIKAEEYIQSKDWRDKSVYILRPCMIHGPGNKGNLNLLYNVISKGVPWPLGKFENKRSFTSVDNLCYILGRILSQSPAIPSGIYNIADDAPIPTNDLIKLICKARNRKVRIWNLPAGLVKQGAKAGDVLRLPLNTFRLNKLTENYVVDNTKIKKALGIEALPVSAPDGIIKTIKSFT